MEVMKNPYFQYILLQINLNENLVQIYKLFKQIIKRLGINNITRIYMYAYIFMKIIVHEYNMSSRNPKL